MTDLDPDTTAKLARVCGHEGFFRIERIHFGHTKDCPQVEDGYPCWRYHVGVSISLGRCVWEQGATLGDAVRKMHARIWGADEATARYDAHTKLWWLERVDEDTCGPFKDHVEAAAHAAHHDLWIASYVDADGRTIGDRETRDGTREATA